MPDRTVAAVTRSVMTSGRHAFGPVSVDSDAVGLAIVLDRDALWPGSTAAPVVRLEVDLSLDGSTWRPWFSCDWVGGQDRDRAGAALSHVWARRLFAREAQPVAVRGRLFCDAAGVETAIGVRFFTAPWGRKSLRGSGPQSVAHDVTDVLEVTGSGTTGSVTIDPAGTDVVVNGFGAGYVNGAGVPPSSATWGGTAMTAGPTADAGSHAIGSFWIDAGDNPSSAAMAVTWPSAHNDRCVAASALNGAEQGVGPVDTDSQAGTLTTVSVTLTAVADGMAVGMVYGEPTGAASPQSGEAIRDEDQNIAGFEAAAVATEASSGASVTIGITCAGSGPKAYVALSWAPADTGGGETQMDPATVDADAVVTGNLKALVPLDAASVDADAVVTGDLVPLRRLDGAGCAPTAAVSGDLRALRRLSGGPVAASASVSGDLEGEGGQLEGGPVNATAAVSGLLRALRRLEGGPVTADAVVSGDLVAEGIQLEGGPVDADAAVSGDLVPLRRLDGPGCAPSATVTGTLRALRRLAPASVGASAAVSGLARLDTDFIPGLVPIEAPARNRLAFAPRRNRRIRWPEV